MIINSFRKITIKLKNPLSIYIHWPFCQAKCPYCDFNSHVRQAIDQDEWTRAYIKTLKYWAKKLPDNQISSIFFGGGTPSLMSDRTINKILTSIQKFWNCQSDIEISLEANPTSVEASKFKSFRESGINRISMGIQALNDKDLKRLGRLHSAKEAKQALDIAKKTFSNVSFDLIYGRQHQTLKSWETELLEAISISVGHLSLYQLTIEKTTRFGDLFSKGKLLGLPNELTSTEFYKITDQICESKNFYAYEISNYTQNGNECQHNLNYWRGGTFLGIGPGAHGRINLNTKRYLTEAPSNPETWLTNTLNDDFRKFTYEELSKIDQAEEYVMMALRLEEGIDIRRYSNLTGKRFPENKITELFDANLIQVDEHTLKTTHAGKLLTNYVIRQLLC